ncbi:cuscuta receptor 1 isoform X3 [Hevea brasiliensis]|uniref:cuscuta receptor 1 isoform X3 n=1 Tax=Hevea brasiliensis TaxID=3981 RepID=UPI0025D03CAF|nr:cuscuta receptor 1 isoform X3 [Hevea brasiliensis]
MEIMKECWILVMILLLRGSWCSDGCLEHERIALLQLKFEFISSSYEMPSRDIFFSSHDYDYDMPLWGVNTDCCNWGGVKCNTTTGHVVELSLDGIRRGGDWYLNASLFLPFQQLKNLSLYGNNIAGCIKNEGFERLSVLDNLELLDLSVNHFNNNILSSLSGLSFLKFLYLYENRLKGIINIEGGEELLKLSNLQILDLSYNNFSINNLSFFNGLSSLKSLSIANIQLKGPFDLKELGLSQLEELDLGENNITKFVDSRETRSSNNIRVLYLYGITIKGSILLESLRVLTHLKSLYLRGSNFEGTIPGQGLPHLKDLEYLALDGSIINNNILQSIGVMSSLKELSLRGCELNDTNFLNQGLPHLKDLEYLELDGSIINNNILQSIGVMSSLKKLSLRGCELNDTKFLNQGLPHLKDLEYLELDGSIINNNILQSIGVMSSLKKLSLSGCELNDTKFLNQGVCKLKQLQDLDISDNEISGSLPSCLANLTSLQFLYLSSNNFIGNISLSALRGLTNLEHLDVSDNLFQIPISMSPFFNHSKLKFFENVGTNKIYAETNDQNLTPKFQLDHLSLSGYACGGAFPKFLYHQHNLQYVDLSSLKMGGGFPYWLLENNTKLEGLFLNNNSLSGPLQLPHHFHMNLSELDISDNFFHGNIPLQIGTYLPRLRYMDLSSNGFNGSIPSSFGNMSLLRSLDLSNNKLSGTIPKHLTMDCVSLREFYLSKNQLQGSLKHAFCDCPKLVVLDLSHNNMTGSIPSGIGRFSQLSYMILGHNNIEGEIPIQLCNLTQLSLIDLSHNNLSGHILPCLRSTSNSYISIADMLITDEALEFTTKSRSYSYKRDMLSYMSGIDLSCNNLTGQIPIQIGSLNEIHVLNLSHNNLIGKIPASFSNLSQVESLDLSYNNLQGHIPSQLTELNFLEVFNVSYNNLSGRTPERVAQFATFDESSYRGNPLLYGWPMQKNWIVMVSPPSTSRSSINDEESNFFHGYGCFLCEFWGDLHYGLIGNCHSSIHKSILATCLVLLHSD